MRIDMDKIINNTIYLGCSALASVGAGLATREIIDLNIISGLIDGAVTLIPIYWASDALKHVRYFRENRERSRELKEICQSFRNSYNEYADLREEMRTIPSEEFR